MSKNKSYVWYAGYGSNLFRERFLYYLSGEPFRLGGKRAEACNDQTFPKTDKQIHLPYSLYFAKNSQHWGNGGVAFINPHKETNKNNCTLGRMWKISCEQYEHVRKQEGTSWYNHEIYLGEEDGLPIHTITHKEKIDQQIPSNQYIKTIALGLKETYNMTNEQIAEYLITKGDFTQTNLIKTISDI